MELFSNQAMQMNDKYDFMATMSYENSYIREDKTYKARPYVTDS